MKRYSGTIRKAGLGARKFNAVLGMCRLEAASSPDTFGYSRNGDRIRFTFTESALGGVVANQLRAIVENDGDGKINDLEVVEDDDSVQPAADNGQDGTGAAAADGTKDLGTEAVPPTDMEKRQAAGVQDALKSGNGQSVKQGLLKKDSVPLGDDVSKGSAANAYTAPVGMEESDDLAELFRDLIITNGLTDAEHPLFNLRHPVMLSLMKAEHPESECPDAVREFNDAVKACGQSGAIAAIFGGHTGGLRTGLAAAGQVMASGSKAFGGVMDFFRRAMGVDEETQAATLKMQQVFGGLFGKKGIGSRPTIAMSKFGKTAARIMKDILHKNGQSHTVRSRIAIAASDIDLNDIDNIDSVKYYELSETGRIKHGAVLGAKPSTMSGDELRSWYQYVNPYRSALTYMKYFDFTNAHPAENSDGKQDAAAVAGASSATDKGGSEKKNYAGILENGGLEYLIFSPKSSLREYDMISNQTVAGGGKQYHALTMKTRLGTVAGFYTADEIKERFV